MRSKVGSSVVSTVPSGPTAALLTRPSMRPWRSMAWPTTRCTSAAFETSASSTSASQPAPASSARRLSKPRAVLDICGCARPKATTRWPRRASSTVMDWPRP
jgi:hypothetical protein